MRYRFNYFEFDSTSLVLKKNGQTLAIRHNEAKVLKLLIEHSDNVFSKEDILSHVWQDKVVSEQAVFQNISHLRSLFGNQAIKTFSKRGYQWQLKVDSIHPDTENTQSVLSSSISHQQSSALAKQKSKNHRLVIALGSLTLFIIAAINLLPVFPQKEKNAVINMAYIPISHQQGAKVVRLDDNEHFDFSELPQLNTANFQASVELEYPMLADEHPLILSGSIRHYNQQTYLDFILKGPFSDWQGQISGIDQQTVLKQLLQHLQQPVIYNLLNKVQAPELKQANLSIAHQKAPKDLIILGQ